MTDAHAQAASAAQSSPKGGGEARTPKSAHAEPASFGPGPEIGRAAAPELAGMASARQFVAAGRELASSHREAALAGADLWSLSFEPFYAFQAGMMRRFDDLWREFANRLQPAEPLRAFSFAPLLGLPPVDVKETSSAYTLSMEVPGLCEQDLRVSVEGDVLMVRGQKSQDREEATSTCHLSERRFGRFERTFRLPRDVVPDRLERSVQDGILKISLPKDRLAGAASEGVVRH